MKVAYLVSRYPALSHTFIEREILSLEAIGVEVARFSVRQPTKTDLQDDVARSENEKTRYLVPPPLGAMAAAALWAVFTRPMTALSVFADAMSQARGVRQRLKWLAYFAEGALLAWWMRRIDARHLHCHFGNSGSSTAMIAAKLASTPFSVTFHGIDLDEPETFRHADKLRDCAFAVCISDFGREQLLAGTKSPYADKVQVVRCGYALPQEVTVTPLPGANRIVCVARLAVEKGHVVLLEALNIVRKRGTLFHCTLVGGGPLEQAVRTQIERLELSDVVTMAGPRSPADVREFVAASDLAVLSSFGEGIPIVLLEAFAQKRPVVATHVGGIPELVRDGENGRLVAPGDPAAFAEAIESILCAPERAVAMGEAGWRVMTTKHDPQASAEKLKQLFHRAIGHQ